MKNFTNWLLPFFLMVVSIANSQNFGWETATDNGATVTETINGVTATVSNSSSDVQLRSDFNGFGGTSGNIVARQFTFVTTFYDFDFSAPVNIISIYVVEADGTQGPSNWVLTPTGGSNSAVVFPITDIQGKQVTVNWQGVTSFRLERQDGNVDTFAIDTIELGTSVSAPTVSTTAATGVGTTTATFAGNATDDGGAAITARGTVYSSTVTNPIVGGAGSTTTNGTGTGTFSESISNLSPGTTYNYRAYATNSEGTSYGATMAVTTVAIVTPTVTTTTATSVTNTSATMGGNVTNDGNASVTSRGVVYSSVDTTPQLGEANVSFDANGSGTGSFSETINGLSLGTLYYYRSYASNSQGTSYGATMSFTTTSLTIPTVLTTTATNVGNTGATLGGDVTSNGGATVTARGTVYSTVAANPTVGGANTSTTTNGTGTGTFSETVSGLTQGTSYNYRAYATNSEGTSYGATMSFSTTAVTIATVSTTTASSITNRSAVLGGNVTDDGGASVTQRGIVISPMDNNPRLFNPGVMEQSNGSGTGSYSATISNLSPSTLYYYAAYSTNSEGDSYGATMNFTTAANVAPVVSITSVSPIPPTNTQAVTVIADATDSNNDALTVRLNWGTSSGNLINSVFMTNTAGDTYSGSIPAQASGTTVFYSVSAQDQFSSTSTTEASYTVQTSGLQVVAVNTLYTIDFDNTIAGINNGAFTGAGLPQRLHLDNLTLVVLDSTGSL